MATASFKVERDIPPPPSRSKYPFGEMEVGDSFLVPGIKTSAEISSAVNYRKSRYGENYICRAVDGGVRVWRTA